MAPWALAIPAGCLSLASLAMWLKCGVLEKVSRFAHPGVSGLEALSCCEG